MRIIDWFWSVCRGLFHRENPLPNIPDAAPLLPQPVEMIQFDDDEAPVPRKKKEHFGAHYYLGDLLDRLDFYFECVGHLRKTKHDIALMISHESLLELAVSSYDDLDPYKPTTATMDGATFAEKIDQQLTAPH